MLPVGRSEAVLLSNSELELMRATQLEAMPESVTIVHPTMADDGQGGYTISGCTTTAYAGRLSLVRGNEEIAPGRFSVVSRPMLTLPHDATVSASDIAYVGGLKYRITFIDNAKSWSTAIRANVERIA